MNIAIPMKLAQSFAFSTGIEFDYLLSEALDASYRASIDPSFDPSKAAFASFVYTCVHRQLCSAVKIYRRRYPPYDELDEDLVSDEPSAERVVFVKELLRQLPDDAKVVADLILNVLDGVPPSRARATIRRRLRPAWSSGRIDRAFCSMERMVRRLERFG